MGMKTEWENNGQTMDRRQKQGTNSEAPQWKNNENRMGQTMNKWRNNHHHDKTMIMMQKHLDKRRKNNGTTMTK